MNLELRLPFLLYYFPAIKYIGQIYGVFFIDAGVTWNNNFPSFSNFLSFEILPKLLQEMPKLLQQVPKLLQKIPKC